MKLEKCVIGNEFCIIKFEKCVIGNELRNSEKVKRIIHFELCILM